MRSKLSNMKSVDKEVLLAPKGERVEMTLNTETALASGLLIQRLTELYDDPVEATVRETISNAIDAVMISTSGDKPEVRISRPSAMNPVLVVEDNGVGMSYEDLKNIYSKYGASTKINDLNQIGAYGLGAKAPLAYGTEFTVTSTKNGIKTTIIVAREEMTNYIKIVSSVKTDEASGTIVSVPLSSRDIERFNKHIDKYSSFPSDKNIDMYIDEELVNPVGWVELPTKALTYSTDSEQVFGRVWIHTSEIVNIISRNHKNRIMENISFVIGGWAYPSPERKNGNYYRFKEGFMVELKAGIVGFNSSRDTILENERYSALSNLVERYFDDNNFIKEAVGVANNTPLSEFKRILGHLLGDYSNLLQIEAGKLVIKEAGSDTQLVSDLVSTMKHSETGFCLDKMISKVPADGIFGIARESRDHRSKTVKNYIFDGSYYSAFTVVTRNYVAEKISSFFAPANTYSQSVGNLMLRMFYDHENFRNRLRGKEYTSITFVADVQSPEDTALVMKNRRTLSLLANENAREDRAFDSYFVLTSKDTKSMKEMVKQFELGEHMTFNFMSVSEVEIKVKEYKDANKKPRNNSKKERRTQLSTELRRIVGYTTNVSTERTSLSEVSEKENNVFILSKERYASSAVLSGIKNWYHNTHNMDAKEIKFYLSCGVHSALDIDLLGELGELYVDPTSEDAGRSKKYSDTVTKAGVHTVENSELSDRKTAIELAVIALAYSRNPSDNANHMLTQIETAKDAAKQLGIPFEIESIEDSFLIQNLQKYSYYNKPLVSTLSLHNSAVFEEIVPHIVSALTEEEKELVNDLLSIGSDGNYFIIQNDGSCSRTYTNSKLFQFGINGDSAWSAQHNKLVKITVEAQLEFLKSVAERLLAIK